jgi:hypothetical protein
METLHCAYKWAQFCLVKFNFDIDLAVDYGLDTEQYNHFMQSSFAQRSSGANETLDQAWKLDIWET